MADDVAEFELRLDDQFSSPAKRAADGVERIQRSLGTTATKASFFGNILSGIALRGVDMLAGAALKAAGAVIGLGKALSVAVFEGASFVQQSRLAFEQLLTGGEDATEVFNDVRREATRLGLGVESTIDSFKGLLAAQFDVGKAKEMIRMGADLRAIGASAEEVKRSMTAITQIKAKGRLMAEELLQLQEAKISQELVFNAIQDMMGLKDTAQVRKTIEAGKVHGDLALEAIARAVKKKVGAQELGEAGADWADRTFSGMAGQLKGQFEIMWQDIGAALLPSLEGLGKKVATFVRSLAPRMEIVKGQIIEAFSSAIAWVDKNWDKIQKTITTGIDVVIVWVNRLSAIWKEHGDKLLPILKAIGLGIAVIVAAGFVLLAAIGLLVAFLGLLVTEIVKTVESAWNLAETFWNLGRAILMGLVNGITSLVPMLVSVVQGIANTILGIFGSVFKFGSPSKVFREMGALTTKGLAIGMEEATPTLRTASADVGAVATGGAAAGMAEGGGGGGGGMTINVAVDAPPGADAAKGEEFGEAIAIAIQRQLAPLLEGALVTEGGT